VERSVPADDDEELGAAVDGVPCELAQVSGSLREERVADETLSGGDVCELGPASPGRPVGRNGVDEKDRVSRGVG
jgi:hypothetical protein